MRVDRPRPALAWSLAAGIAASASPAHASGALQIIPDPPVLVVLLVFFVALVPLLNRLLFQPLLRVLEDRGGRIDGARARAERVNQEAEASLARYEAAVRGAAAEAERDRKAALEVAQRQHATSVAAARADAQGVIERARAEVGAALVAARGTLQAQSRELAREAAARVLGRSLSS